MIACPEVFNGGFGGLGNSATWSADLGDYWDPDIPDCTRYLYTWGGIRDSQSLTEEEWDDGKGWPGAQSSGYVLSPILYDDETVENLISRIYEELPDTEDYTIYEVHFFGRQQTLNGSPTTYADWWTVLYLVPTFLKYQAWTLTDPHPEYVPHTMLENVDRGNID